MITMQTNKTTPFILSFCDRFLQRFKEMIHSTWIIKNPSNLPFNIAHTIDHIIKHKIEPLSAKTPANDSKDKMTELQTIDDPETIQSLPSHQEKAAKILEIAEKLLKIRKEQSSKSSIHNLQDCIQHVCSYAFTGWIFDSEKKKISQEISLQLQNVMNPKPNDDRSNTPATVPHISFENLHSEEVFTSAQSNPDLKQPAYAKEASKQSKRKFKTPRPILGKHSKKTFQIGTSKITIFIRTSKR